MKIPYGLSNFKDVITEGYLYIDKTSYIEKLEEQGKFNILLRPRRFGKSLFLSSLWHYYDIRYKDDFDTIFSNLYIGQHPTPLQSSYQILFMEFSGIATDDTETVRRDFEHEVRTDLRNFLQIYNYPDAAVQRVEEQSSSSAMMKTFFQIIGDKKIYILIDEYDHFANTILGDNLELYKKIVGKGGFVRSFYETIKRATMEGIVDRLFITGVTSITLDSLTSGFNIGDNITLHRDFNQAIGFTRQETASVIQPLVEVCNLDRKTLLDDMSKWYNGYLFNEEQTERIYNSDMVLYFVKNFNVETCRYPKKMLDENIASDYGKILQFFAIGDRDSNYEVLEELITTGEVVAEHKGKFDITKNFDRDDFVSLLLYMGFVTILGYEITRLRYGIPNHVIERLYYEYFKVEVEQRSQITIDNRKIQDAIAALAMQGTISPLAAEIKKVLELLSNRDFMNMDEKHIKAIILTLLYQSKAYYIKSEAEVNNRYPDIMLLERNPIKVNHQFLLELKYSKKSAGKQGWQKKKAEGIAQVEEYLQLKEIRELQNLKAYLLLTNGTELEVIRVKIWHPSYTG